MEFGVVYTVDVKPGERLKPYLPRPSVFCKMRVTESKEHGGDVGYGKHRKYGAVFTKEEFERFVDDVGLVADSVETMGTLGAPGSGLWYGCSPAVSFDGTEPGAYQNAYVTPYPGFRPKRDLTPEKEERWFQMIKKAMVQRYGHHGTFTKWPQRARSMQ